MSEQSEALAIAILEAKGNGATGVILHPDAAPAAEEMLGDGTRSTKGEAVDEERGGPTLDPIKALEREARRMAAAGARGRLTADDLDRYLEPVSPYIAPPPLLVSTVVEDLRQTVRVSATGKVTRGVKVPPIGKEQRRHVKDGDRSHVGVHPDITMYWTPEDEDAATV